jgi:hypothetical protein
VCVEVELLVVEAVEWDVEVDAGVAVVVVEVVAGAPAAWIFTWNA